MAKFWEVIKAFQEGTAVVAYRDHNKRVKIVNEENGITFYDKHNEPYENQSLSNYDMSMEWEIIETQTQKEFRFLQVIFRLYKADREPRLLQLQYENDSLTSVLMRATNDYFDETVLISSAVGISEKGEITILVQEGEQIE